MQKIETTARTRVHLAGLAVATVLHLILGAASWAADPLELLDWKNRPTVNDLLSVINPLEAENPFTPRQADDLVNDVVEEGTRIIVDLEHVFPKHLWAPLGRDTTVVSDILESYSILYEQDDRVVRIHASGQSFTLPEQYIGLLQTAGLLDSLGKPLAPFILLDPTCWGSDGQIRKLAESVFAANPRLSPYTVNAVALGGSGRTTKDRLIPITKELPDLDEYKTGKGAPSHILETSGRFSYLGLDVNNVEMAWHEKFGELKYYDGRGWIAEPGAAMSRETRNHILWRMFEIYKKVASREFKNRLMLRAVTYGMSPSIFRINPPFSLQAPADAKALHQWILSWRSYSSKPRYSLFKSTIEMEISNSIARAAELRLDRKELSSLLKVLSEPDKKTLVDILLTRSSDVARSLEILNASEQNQRAELARTHLSRFISFRPSVAEANQFIECLGKESDAHVSFVTQLFPLMGSKCFRISAVQIIRI